MKNNRRWSVQTSHAAKEGEDKLEKTKEGRKHRRAKMAGENGGTDGNEKEEWREGEEKRKGS